jgi:dTDP-glucose 4,6-dehydratase
MPQTCVVIGSNCFTGSHIVEALLRDLEYSVIGVSRSPEYLEVFLPYKNHAEHGKRFQFFQIDIVKNFDALVHLIDRFRPDLVINIAALSEVVLSNHRPVEYFEVNTLGTVRLCNYLRQLDFLKQYVHISSAEIFGSCDKPVTEDDPFNPSTPYGVSKAAADMHIKTLIKNFGFPATMIRSTNVYGKHQQLFKIIPRSVIYLKTGRTIELHGGGKAIKSFIHIRDVVDGLMLTVQRKKFGTFHFTVPSHKTIAEIVRQIASSMGYDFEKSVRVVKERLGQDTQYLLDCGRAEEELGWMPKVSFQEGVRETIDWIETNWETLQPLPLSYEHKVGV